MITSDSESQCLIRHKFDLFDIVIISNMMNKGTGAGGSQTNVNGLSFEVDTLISSEFSTKEMYDHNKIRVVESTNGTRFKTGSKKNYHHIMREFNPDYVDIPLLHGTKEPDEYYNTSTDSFILETKYQCQSGSVCEKLQTSPMKQKRLQRMYPNHRIHYMYILSPWFRDNCAAELEELQAEGIPYFIADSTQFKKDVLSYMGAI